MILFVETTLNDGAVRVFNGKQGVKLRPDEQAVYDEGKFTVRKVDASRYSAWKKEIHVVESFVGEYYDSFGALVQYRYILGESRGKEYHFSGELARYEDFTEILRMLELATRVHLR